VLPAALVVVAVAGAVSAAVATLARTELMLARNRETAARALAAADACAASVTAGLPAGWEFEGPIAGDDGVAGTADDGLRPAPPGCSARLHTAPGAVAPPRALLDIEALAGAGRRMLEGVLARSPLPGAPALIWLAGSGSLRDPTGTLTLDASDASRPGTSALAPLAAPDDPSTLDAWLAANAVRVAVTPSGAAPLRAPGPPTGELAARMRDAGALPGGTLVPSGTAPLALTLVTGALFVPASARGRGLLHVGGLLDIGGSFEFSGVVVADRGIRVASGGRLDVTGAIWLGAGATLVVDGEARVAARATELEAADGLLALPRLARLAGLRDPP